MINTKTILVTGASGFVGANLVRYFLKNNFDVHIILRKNANVWRIKDILSRLHIHESDISDKNQLKKLFKKVEPNFIFHLAAFGAYSSQTDLEQMVKTNIIGLKNLLEASIDIPYSCFVVTGSSSEYGFKKKKMRETDYLEPTSFYAATKGSATLLSEVFSKKYNKPIIVFRLFSVYGPYEDPTRFVPVAMHAALEDQTLNVTPGKVRRDFVYVDDVIYAYKKAMQKKWNRFEILNVGTGRQYTNQHVAKIIKRINKNKLNIAVGEFKPRLWDTDYWVADILKTKKILGWVAKNNLIQGLQKTYRFYMINQNLLETQR